MKQKTHTKTHQLAKRMRKVRKASNVDGALRWLCEMITGNALAEKLHEHSQQKCIHFQIQYEQSGNS